MIFNQDQDQQINIVNSLAAAAEEMAAAAVAEDPADILEGTAAAEEDQQAAADQKAPAAGSKEPTAAAEPLSRFEIDQYIEAAPTDSKGRKVVPDSFFDTNYRNLPNNIVNESGTFRSYNGGKLGILGGDPEKDKEIWKKGAEALNAAHARRRSMAEDLEIMLQKVDKSSGLTEQEKGLAAMVEAMQAGNVKAGEFVRNTVGEQPVNKQEISADIMTEADRALMKNCIERLQKLETQRKNDQKIE